MNENINLVEILSGVPAGTSLYSPLFGTVSFKEVDTSSRYPIVVEAINENGIRMRETFTKDGFYCSPYSDSKCMLFPSERHRDWNRFMMAQRECGYCSEYCKKLGYSRCAKCCLYGYKIGAGDAMSVMESSESSAGDGTSEQREAVDDFLRGIDEAARMVVEHESSDCDIRKILNDAGLGCVSLEDAEYYERKVLDGGSPHYELVRLYGSSKGEGRDSLFNAIMSLGIKAKGCADASMEAPTRDDAKGRG